MNEKFNSLLPHLLSKGFLALPRLLTKWTRSRRYLQIGELVPCLLTATDVEERGSFRDCKWDTRWVWAHEELTRIAQRLWAKDRRLCGGMYPRPALPCSGERHSDKKGKQLLWLRAVWTMKMLVGACPGCPSARGKAGAARSVHRKAAEAPNSVLGGWKCFCQILANSRVGPQIMQPHRQNLAERSLKECSAPLCSLRYHLQQPR